MDRKEQEIINKISEKTKDIEVPESLSPGAIRKMTEDKQGQKTKSSKGKKINKFVRYIGMAAACFALIAGVWAVSLMNPGTKKGSADSSKALTKNESKEITAAADYDEIYSYIENYNDKNRQETMYSTDIRTEESTTMKESADQAMSDTSVTSAKSSQADSGSVDNSSYSTTNVRQEGVDEADIVKTDGTYLYVLKDNREEIGIVQAEEGVLKEYGNIQAGKGRFIEEFYLNTEKKKLILIQSDQGQGGISPLSDSTVNISSTEAVTYDLSDVSNPKEAGKITQSGTYSSSRMSGDYIYLFSTFYTGQEIARTKKESFVPLVNGKVLTSSSIYLPSIDEANMYEVITAADIEAPNEVTDSKAVFSKGGDLYVSEENIYYYETDRWDRGEPETTVRKVTYKDGRLKAAAQGKFDGYLNDSFSIDEYNGYLRVVTTAGDTNSVYVLDKELNMTGSIEGLAEDERIYSARMMGDIGYFVTFRETDPLFSVDLSDPENPKIIGALKIPGFSDYLHFYGENRLVGIGMDVDEKTGTTNGVKLTMFDISDSTDVKEADTYILENVFGTDVGYDYKAVLIDANKNIIGFSAYMSGGQSYYLFNYDDKEGFSCLMEEEINGNAMMSTRGLYIGDVLYVAQGNIVESYSLKDYKKIDDIIL